MTHILAHSFTPLPPVTPELQQQVQQAILKAQQQAEAERILADLADQVVFLCETYGYQRIHRLVRHAATLAGETL